MSEDFLVGDHRMTRAKLENGSKCSRMWLCMWCYFSALTLLVRWQKDVRLVENLT